MRKHSPLPWSINSYGDVRDADGFSLPVNGFTLPGGSSKPDHRCLGNTALIVQAVNSHADLLNACKVALWTLEGVPGGGRVISISDCIEALQNAIAKAEGDA
jgi:hypothetical protein